MLLVFNQASLPRTITQQQWKEIWRWKRVTEQRLKKSIEEQIALLSIYGTTMPKHVRNDMINVIVNPPLMIYPDTKFVDMDLRPGAISYVR